MLIVGLGNPGKEYIGTRHNVGRDFLLELAAQRDFSDWKSDSYVRGLVSEGALVTEKNDVTLILPETFMNRSGETVKAMVKKLNLQPQEVLVIYDDIDLPVGSIKISVTRGTGGHNGVKSIIDHLGTNDFMRIRIGICPVSELGDKKKPFKDDVSRFVLARFSPEEREKMARISEQLPLILRVLKEDGVDRAMNLFNKK